MPKEAAIMNTKRLILRRLWHYRRTNLGVLLGAVLAATVLVGALMVGDSVRYSLTRLTESRLGKTDYVVTMQDRFFDANLSSRLAEEDGSVQIVPVLLLNGVVLTPDGEQRVNAVQVVGIDDNFWDLAPTATDPPHLETGSCLINTVLARRLGFTDPGESIVLRLRKPGGLPADMTLATRDQDQWARHLRVDGMQSPDAFGYFTLKTTQTPEPTLFLPLSWLSEQLDIPGRANVLLIHAAEGQTTREALQDRLDAAWQLADAGLQIEPLEDTSVELLSDHVFIPPAIADTAFEIWPDVRPVTTYLVNSIRVDEKATPYSFASAPGPPRVPDTMADDEVLINDWLAEDIGATTGTSLTITYYAVDTGGRLVEESADFRVADIIATESVAAKDRQLVPFIPGLTDADNCRDWDPGIPINLDRIRDRDEAYWSAYGPLPKLYLTQAAAQQLWENRFGTYTALRFHNADNAATPETIRERLHDALRSTDLGFTLHAARADGISASEQAVDFGELFIGLSFFLILSAILLTTLLFAFSMQQRAQETGTLRALGIPAQMIRKGLLAEGGLLVVAGAALGSVLAMGYNKLILLALQTLWQDAVRVTVFQIHVRPLSILIGALVVVLAALVSMAWVLRGQARLNVRALQHQNPDDTDRRTRHIPWIAGTICILAAIVISLTVSAGQGREAAGAFFACGGLLLAGMILLAYAGFAHLSPSTEAPTRHALLIWRAVARRRGRSVACLSLMALGVFLVVAVAANRRGTVRNPDDPSSGTGGWQRWGQTTLPLVHDLNSPRGRARYGLSDSAFDHANLTMLRLREGDDASCLNLNRVTEPHLLGIDPEAWDQRGAFTFARLAPGVDPAHPWLALSEPPAPDVVPAFADMADITWGLGKSVGDTLTYTDEQGRPFEIKLMGGIAPSILQGHLILSEENLMQRYPSLGGVHILLVDAPNEHVDTIDRILTRRLGDLGLEMTPTVQRLAEFNTVENTYLSIFMLLGGLGVLLGSIGLGIVAARNMMERRTELALLRALGFRRKQILLMLFLEHGALATAGLLIGAMAAAVAVTPALMAPETVVPWTGLILTIASILVGSLIWIALAIHTALRGSLLPALRNE